MRKKFHSEIHTTRNKNNRMKTIHDNDKLIQELVKKLKDKRIDPRATLKDFTDASIFFILK